MAKIFFRSTAAALLVIAAAHGAEAGPKKANTLASWYGPGFEGKRMANGEIFSPDNPSCAAHPFLPFYSQLRITNLKNGRSIYVRVCDRGPYRSDKKPVVIDLSHAAAILLDFEKTGLARVDMVLSWHPGITPHFD